MSHTQSFAKAAALITALLAAPPLLAQERISHGRFKDVALYRPTGEVKSFVLFLSGDSGWNKGVVTMAQALVDQGAMVAGISAPQLRSVLAKDGGTCVSPAGDLENLAHYLQGYAKLPKYYTPMLVGYSSGATLAYAMLAQAGPAATFSSALSLGFCPDLKLKKPLCEGGGVHFTRRKDGKGMNLLPSNKLRSPWVVLQGAEDRVCDASTTRNFVSQVQAGAIVMLPQVGHGFSETQNWMPQYLAAFLALNKKPAAATSAPPATLTGLPIVEVPAAGVGDTFAVLLSGDGGWAGLDKEVAATLAAKGIPVVGLDSLRYFWTARTPQGLATDLDRILRYYAAHWKKRRAVVIGYSQGADVLPFALNRLPETSRTLVVQTVLMGLSDKASFEFHLTNWIGRTHGALLTLPEVSKLAATATLCIYGKDDKEALCPKLPARNVNAQALPGGHHFGGNYDQLAELIAAHSR